MLLKIWKYFRPEPYLEPIRASTKKSFCENILQFYPSTVSPKKILIDV